jgi:hypothetical protein
MPNKKGSSRRKTAKSKKGGYYSFSGDVGVPGGANWTRHSEMGDWAVSNRAGNAQYGRGRKRKGKKGGKTRKLKRGGGSFGAVSASYQGTGARGIADVVGISPNKPGFATQGEFNYYGGKPGDGLPNFISAGSK